MKSDVELRSEGINGRRSHSFACTEYNIGTSLPPPAGRETAALRIGKNERARRIRHLSHHGKFDLKIGDCRERRTSYWCCSPRAEVTVCTLYRLRWKVFKGLGVSAFSETDSSAEI